ncbi:hypothetical protein BDV59DRAFT_53999 [Aspergillus ambiguus]|uniref:uncharacterized protein n=1 Tax=Aspergillus ambiguus TaxID=176160 RepID=UPI003CCD6F95
MIGALEQAGSLVKGWISSCLFCPGSGDDDESFHHQQSITQRGAERDMEICHTQPHLVPPMRLVVYDDLPSPGLPPRRASSIPSWVVESSRSIASRASNRASMTFRRKYAAPAPLRISAPSDFRRVATFSMKPDDTTFTPLELSFNTPKNPLPDLLHIFDDIPPDDDRQRQSTLGLNRPPRALSSPTGANPLRFSRSSSHHPSSSFQLPRKPVGSGSRRSSLATLEQLLDAQPAPIASPLIPHFSTRSSAMTGLTASVISALPSRLDFPGPSSAGITTAPRTPCLPDRPAASPRLPPKDTLPPQYHQQRPPTASLDTRPATTTTTSSSSETTVQRTPPRAGRVTQWLFQTSSWKPAQPSHPVNPFRIRSRTRTLSGSTVASAQTNMTAAFKTPSVSSAATTLAGPPPVSARALPSPSPDPFPSSTLAKELELSPAPSSFSRPLLPSLVDERPHPTIYEGQPQKPHEYDGLALSPSGSYRHSAVGVAF